MNVLNTSKLLTNIWLLGQHLEGSISSILGNIGFYHPRAFFLLNSLSQYPYPATLATALNLPPPTVTFILKQLEHEKLVERNVDKKDLRRYRFSVTTKGQEALLSAHEAINRTAKSYFNKLSSSEMEDFEKLVGLLNH